MSGGGAKMFGDNFVFSGGNRALLGVVSEKNDNGAKITSVTKESAAEKAGLKKDDIITKVGDTKIEGQRGPVRSHRRSQTRRQSNHHLPA
jgi:serine protease Do